MEVRSKVEMLKTSTDQAFDRIKDDFHKIGQLLDHQPNKTYILNLLSK
jgi:hypothetical protein